jgi:hypothetical protein
MMHLFNLGLDQSEQHLLIRILPDHIIGLVYLALTEVSNRLHSPLHGVGEGDSLGEDC